MARVLVGGLVAAVAFPMLYAAVVPEERAEAVPLALPPEGAYRVTVVDWGYHGAILVEQPPGWRLGPEGAEGAPVVEYAWGDRGFYRDSDFRPHAVAAALVAPTPSVVYLRGHPTPPVVRGADAVWVREVGADTLRALVHDLERSIRREADGGRSPSQSAPGYSGRFFAAHGAYLWTRNCNGWVVARLASAGLAGSPRGVVVTPQIGGRLRGFERVGG